MSQQIILGCGNFGGIGSLPEFYGRGDSEKQSFSVLNLAREFGLSRFDTANSYGGGASEEFLGKWLRQQDSSFRAEAQITTKVGNPHGARPGHNPFDISEIQFHAQASLRRLGIDRIGTYYLHEFPPTERLDEVLEALDGLLQKGQISSIGLSNVTKENIESFTARAGARLNPFLSQIQNEFHLLKTLDQSELMPSLKEHGIQYSAFSPLAGGLLTGKYQFQIAPPEGSRLALRREPYEVYLNAANFKKIDDFLEKTRGQNITPAQAALQFVLDAGVDSVVVGPRNRKHFEDLGFK